MPAPIRSLLKTTGKRLTGSQPGRFPTILGALTVGGGAALATFKVLRSGHSAREAT